MNDDTKPSSPASPAPGAAPAVEHTHAVRDALGTHFDPTCPACRASLRAASTSGTTRGEIEGLAVALKVASYDVGADVYDAPRRQDDAMEALLSSVDALREDRDAYRSALETQSDLARERLDRALTAERALILAREQKDGAYRERDQVVALAARMAAVLRWPTWLGRHEDRPGDPPWEDDWRNIVFIDLPSGQVSWHIHNSELTLFAFLPHRDEPWDGHDTTEKYRRCDAPWPLDRPLAVDARVALAREEARRPLADLRAVALTWMGTDCQDPKEQAVYEKCGRLLLDAIDGHRPEPKAGCGEATLVLAATPARAPVSPEVAPAAKVIEAARHWGALYRSFLVCPLKEAGRIAGEMAPLERDLVAALDALGPELAPPVSSPTDAARCKCAGNLDTTRGVHGPNGCFAPPADADPVRCAGCSKPVPGVLSSTMPVFCEECSR